MGRKEISRNVDSPPDFFRFRAERSPIETSTEHVLQFDEFEALRLSDRLGYDHGDGAQVMGISRPTYTRLLKRARKKIATFLIDGGRLEIRGGEVLFADDVYCCLDCHRPFKWHGSGEPRCPACGETRIIKARPSCRHDCHCCEQAGEGC